MAGIRLMHEKERGCIVAVVHPSRKLRAPILCEQCHEVHATKTVHLILDDDGATIVSPEVLKLLKEAGMPSLRSRAKSRIRPPRSYAWRDPLASSRPPRTRTEVAGSGCTS